jgi:hypothetical protein
MNFDGSETLYDLIPEETITDASNAYTRKSFKTNNYWYLFTGNYYVDTIFKSVDLSTWTEIPLPETYGVYSLSTFCIYVDSNDVIYAVCQARQSPAPFTYKVLYGEYNGSWTWEIIDLPSNYPITPYIVVDTSGTTHIAIELYSINIYYTENSGGWSAWESMNTYYGGNSLITGIDIDISNNIYIFGSESDGIGGYVTACYVKSGGSWTTIPFSDNGLYSANIVTEDSTVYFIYTTYEYVYLVSGTGTSLSRETLVNIPGVVIAGAVGICHDGTNLHMMYIYNDSGIIYTKYIYGTPGDFSSPINMLNAPSYSIFDYPFFYAEGMWADANRLMWACSGAGEPYYFIIGENDATQGNDEEEPSESGGRFYHYNAAQTAFKLTRNIKYNDSGTYKIARKMLSYGDLTGVFKRVRF